MLRLEEELTLGGKFWINGNMRFFRRRESISPHRLAYDILK